MSEVTVSTPEATAQEPVADDPQQSIAAGMDAPSSERDPPVPVVTTGSGVTVSNSHRASVRVVHRSIRTRTLLRYRSRLGKGAGT